jgi:hypothetical protein
MSTTQQSRPEANRICNLIPSRDTDGDWRIEHALKAGAIALPDPTLPGSVDLRHPWWDIGNQGATGSCVGWGSTDGVARYHFAQAGRIAKTDHLSIRLSWMGSKEFDTDPHPNTFIESAGTTLKGAVQVLKKYGAVPDSVLPFDIPGHMYLGEETTFFATAALRRISAYFNLGKNVASWRTWLANHGPILAGLNVDSTWDHATSASPNLDTFHPSTIRGGHAIAIVGYRPDHRFIVRNSWGAGWGDHGYAYASEAYIAAAFFNESYGVTL